VEKNHVKNVTLPKTGAPWKFGDSYWKPPFLGAMLSFREGKSVFFSDVFFVFLPIRFACLVLGNSYKKIFAK